MSSDPRITMIRALNQFPHTMLAKQFGYSAGAISRIVANKSHFDPSYTPPDRVLTKDDLIRAIEELRLCQRPG